MLVIGLTGNIGCGKSSLSQIFAQQNIKIIDADIIAREIYNDEKLLSEIYSSRTDEARDAIRAAESRIILGENIIEPENTINKEYGDITIDNVHYQRYMGELQILKVNQKGDKRTNVVASILQNRLYLLKYIRNGKRFYFNIINK